jgi:hypothetical protein
MTELESRERKSRIVLLLFILATAVVIFAWRTFTVFWAFPAPSDPLEYLGPASWGTTVGYWPFLDRLSLGVGLRLFVLLLPLPAYKAGMVYIATVNAMLIALAVFWSFRKAGAFAALLAAVFSMTSFYYMAWATYIYPDQTVAMYAFLAFIAFFWSDAETPPAKCIFTAGIFAAFAALSKGTGPAVGIFLAGWLVFNRKWKELGPFIGGGITGGLTVMLLFAVLYNPSSLLDAISQFLNPVSDQAKGIFEGSRWNNMVSFLDILLRPIYFPVYLGLFVMQSAYRDRDARRLMLAAWSAIGLIYAIYSLTPRGGQPINTYIMTAYPLAATGLAIALGKNSKENRFISHWAALGGFAVILIIMGFSGYWFGTVFPPIRQFLYDHMYYQPLDIFDYRYQSAFPLPVRIVYILGPLFSAALLLISSVKGRAAVAIALAVVTTFWGMALNSSLAAGKMAIDQRNNFFYQAAPILNQTGATDFGVYVKSWNQARPWNDIDRIMWVYWLFFDERDPAMKGPQRMYESQKETYRRITICRTPAELNQLRNPEKVFPLPYHSSQTTLTMPQNKTHVLTDDPAAVLSLYPSAVREKTIQAKTTDIGPQTLFVYRLNAEVKPQPGSDPLAARQKILLKDSFEENQPVSLRIFRQQGVAASQIISADGRPVMLATVQPGSPNEQRELVAGYDTGNLPGTMPAGTPVTLSVTAQLQQSAGGQCLLFMQDRDAPAGTVTEPVTPGGWQTFRITRASANAAPQVIGVVWQPGSPTDKLQIDSITIGVIN